MSRPISAFVLFPEKLYSSSSNMKTWHNEEPAPLYFTLGDDNVTISIEAFQFLVRGAVRYYISVGRLFFKCSANASQISCCRFGAEKTGSFLSTGLTDFEAS